MRYIYFPILIIGMFFIQSCKKGAPSNTADTTLPDSVPPKNVILMISDGCGFSQVEAASYFQFGETGKAPYDTFAVRLAMSTFSAGGDYLSDSAWLSFDYILRKPTDSAAAATAMASGEKTYNGAIGVDVDKKPLVSSFERADSLGKATGVVTSVPLSHATPAAFGAHNVSRKNYAEIGREMIMESPLEVIMGAGHPYYDAEGKKRDVPVFDKVGGPQTWAALLAGKAGADADGDGRDDPWTLIEKKEDFRKMARGTELTRLIGIPFAGTTLQEERAGDPHAAPFTVPFNDNVPTLADMSLAALNVLNNDPDGFYLMIEGGAVDWAGHANRKSRVIEEEIDFNKTVAAVVDWIENNGGWNKNLLIVTGDHETGFLSGPESVFKGTMRWQPVQNRGKGNMPAMEWNATYHSNSLIPFYAHGKGSVVFKNYATLRDSVRGAYLDNTHIARAMMRFLKKQ